MFTNLKLLLFHFHEHNCRRMTWWWASIFSTIWISISINFVTKTAEAWYDASSWWRTKFFVGQCWSQIIPRKFTKTVAYFGTDTPLAQSWRNSVDTFETTPSSPWCTSHDLISGQLRTFCWQIFHILLLLKNIVYPFNWHAQRTFHLKLLQSPITNHQMKKISGVTCAHVATLNHS